MIFCIFFYFPKCSRYSSIRMVSKLLVHSVSSSVSVGRLLKKLIKIRELTCTGVRLPIIDGPSTFTVVPGMGTTVEYLDFLNFESKKGYFKSFITSPGVRFSTKYSSSRLYYFESTTWCQICRNPTQSN